MSRLPGFVCIKHPSVQDTIELQRDIVGCDGRLAGYLNRILLQAPYISNLVDDWHKHGKTGLQDPVELSHALDNPCCLLRDEAYDGVCRKTLVRREVCWRTSLRVRLPKRAKDAGRVGGGMRGELREATGG
jgi:hypothetical protein